MERTALAQDMLKLQVSVTKTPQKQSKAKQSKFHLFKRSVRCGSEKV
jgi:hypothetical protein